MAAGPSFMCQLTLPVLPCLIFLMENPHPVS
jgi:hypothetical protein